MIAVLLAYKLKEGISTNEGVPIQPRYSSTLALYMLLYCIEHIHIRDAWRDEERFFTTITI